MIGVSKARLSASEYAELILRLAGVDGASGGGLPLPDAFRAIAEYLIEEGLPVPEESIVPVVRNAGAIPLKERRIISIWGSWEDFTRALLLVMRQEYLAVFHTGHNLEWKHRETVTWNIHSSFCTGRYYPVIVIPERELEIGFTAYSPLEKMQRSRKDAHLTSLRKLRAEIEQDGLLLADVDYYFSRLIGMLDGKTRKPRNRGRPSVGTEDPPDDEPGHFVMCTKGGEDKELTRENFSQYSSRGRWYWNRECTEHASTTSRHHPGVKTSGLSKQAVREAIERLSVHDMPPSARSVARYLEQDDDRQVRKYWDELAAEGRVPRRQTK